MKSVRIVANILFYLTRVAAVLYLITAVYSLLVIVLHAAGANAPMVAEEGRFEIYYPFTTAPFLLGDYNNAIKQLKDFSTDQVQFELRTAGLLGDAHSELGKKQEAIDYYKKAGTMFDKDDANSPEYLFRAAMLSQELGKYKEAIELLHQIKEKYPNSQRSFEVDKHLGKLGDLN